MKTHIVPVLFSILTGVVSAHPRDYLPPPPPMNKNLSDYTVLDVVGGTFASKKDLPNGHPFKNVNGSEEDVLKIKSEWGGAKIVSNVDAILAYVVQTENREQEYYVPIGIYWLIHEIMDVPASDKAAAFVRVYEIQTDVVKKRKVAFLAERLFPYLADERLLLPLKDMLDETSVHRFDKAEGAADIPVTTRAAARRLFSRILKDKDLLSAGTPEGEVLMSADDRAAIFGEDVPEAESCALLKAWLTSHWQEITNQAASARARKDREYRRPPSLGLIPPLLK